jgi:hypothetical protein
MHKENIKNSLGRHLCKLSKPVETLAIQCVISCNVAGFNGSGGDYV